jgi:hypothetical protein
MEKQQTVNLMEGLLDEILSITRNRYTLVTLKLKNRLHEPMTEWPKYITENMQT